MCDTFIALPAATADGSVLFGKNSDREPNEAQYLEYHPARTYETGETLQCTYLQIPQVRSTYAVVLSRPFWMWGAEMGSNEKGVVIGNEAVFTRMSRASKAGLTGMDLLRLGLERSATAVAALDTIVELLAEYGQGGACGFEDKRLTYHNSFIIADPAEAWVLETAGPLWAALKVTDCYAISNCLSIGEHFDRSHPDVIATARRRGWLKPGRTFHFARCFSDWFYTTFSASRRRQGRTSGLMQKTAGKLDVPSALGILRDHHVPTYSPDTHLLLDRVCAHAANPLTRFAAQSTASFVAHLKADRQTYWATGTSAPCTGVFKPFWFEDKVLPDLGPPPAGHYDPAALWWNHEKLHRLVLADYRARIGVYRAERDQLEENFFERAAQASAGECWQVTRAAFQQAWEASQKWMGSLQELPVHKRPRAYYRHFWNRQNKKAGLAMHL
jgi:dipeptidase